MNVVFADTFFFLALLFEGDESHEAAKKLTETLQGKIVTSEWILVEVADAMATPGNREQFAPFLHFLRNNPLVSIIEFNQQEVFRRAIELYDQRTDKKWSLTDCTSFVIMQRDGIPDALTGDRHFEQAGFNAIMK